MLLAKRYADAVDRLDATKGSKAFAGGAVAGGLLGMLLGGNSRRGGGLLGFGGAAALGAMALQAYQNYQRQQAGGAARFGDVGTQALPHARPAADGSPFELTLVRAMVGAAKAAEAGACSSSPARKCRPSCDSG